MNEYQTRSLLLSSSMARGQMVRPCHTIFSMRPNPLISLLRVSISCVLVKSHTPSKSVKALFSYIYLHFRSQKSSDIIRYPLFVYMYAHIENRRWGAVLMELCAFHELRISFNLMLLSRSYANLMWDNKMRHAYDMLQIVNFPINPMIQTEFLKWFRFEWERAGAREP